MVFSKLKIISLSVIITSLVFGYAQADDDDHYADNWGTKTRPGLYNISNTLYEEECGSCHMPYQPGLLPAQSWEQIMLSLDNHFGENAELDKNEQVAILKYLLDNAAGRIDYRLSNKMMRNIKTAPLRITQLPYFVHEHREIPKRMVQNNPGVRSFSQCDACHTQAKQGIYNEHQVRIPGYGRFED